MTKAEAVKRIDERMCFGRGKWSEHHMPEIDDYWIAGQMAIKALEQPEPKWIPCSERLPEKFQTCIVTDELRQCTYEYDYDPKNEFTKKYGWRYNGRQIIAWMSLPEPWKGDADEN